MIKKFSLKLIVFIVACLYSSMLTAQINTPSGAVVPFNSNPNYGTNGIMPTNLPSGGTYGKSQDAADAYNEWKASYTESCGSGMSRVKFDDPAVTVSEGIAYGMQLAAYAADKALFDGLYKYWKNFQSPSTSGRTGKLMNWKINGCASVASGGTGSAADADIDAAWALLIAETQWPTVTSPYDYGAEASAMLQSARALDLYNNQLINGDGWGTSNSCRNPSYQAPAYYRVFQTVDNATWNGAISGGYTLINANLTKSGSTTGLVSDWSDPSGNRNTCNSSGLGGAPTDGYGYDACRNPWRMAQDVIWNNEAQAKTICSQIAAYVSTKGAGGVGGPVYQNGNNYAGFAHNATFVSTFAMAIMGSTNQTLMNSMYTETKNTKDVIKNSSLSGYFGNTLRCVSLFMMTGNFWKYGTTSFQEINVRKATTAIDILSGTDYDFQTQQIAGSAPAGKLGTLTIENLGFAPLNLTGSTKVVLSGPNAADFILTQPSAATLALGQTTDFTVTFKPTTAGDKTATLTIANNDGDENPYIINLIGTGTLNATAPKMSVFDAETRLAVSNNGTIAMGTSSAGSIDVRRIGVVNTGDAILNLTSVTALGTGYSMVAIPATPTTVAINDTGYVFVQVTSAANGTPSGSVTIVSNDNANPSFKINLTSNFVSCSNAITTNEVYQDFDANFKNSLLGYTVAGFVENFDNPFINEKNPSTKVAQLTRSSANYQGPRYGLCSPSTVNLTTAKFVVSMLVYSPAAGVSIQMNLKTNADVAAVPPASPNRSSVFATTTKANQWERVYFNHTGAIGVGSITNIEIYIDPTSPVAARVYYIDDIKLDIAPCLTDNSGVIQDFDNHNNSTLAYGVAGYTPFAPNTSSTGLNTSPNVGKFVKSATAAAYSDGIRYVGCGGKMDFTTKKYVSMLVYSTVANARINLSPKIGATDVLASTPFTFTVFANTWHRVYFDLSAIPTASLPNVTGLDIFFDPTNAYGPTLGSQTYMFDDIRFESTMPCVAGIPATGILNDFENNRYLGVEYPAAPTYNTIKTNTVSGGINTSSVISEFLRGTLATGTSVRFSACQNKLDLSPGNNIIEMKVYTANAGVPITMSLKNLGGTTLQDVTDTVRVANTWTTVRFDFTNLLNLTTVAFIDVIPDPNAKFAISGSAASARTYYFDDIKYAPASPEINIKALATTATDIPNKGSFALGTAVIGDSTAAVDFSIQNNGLQTLTLTGPTYITLAGANPGDFVVTTTQSFTPSISALGATGFSVMFKPKGTVAGPRSASITIKSNDADEGTYVIYLNGTATAPLIGVLDGPIASSPAVPTNNIPAINVGSSAAGTPAAAYTFSIKNSGNGPLSITSVLGSAGFVASALTPVSPIPAGALSTFTVIGTPALPGVNTGTITIKSTDPLTPTYVVNVTVTGSVPTLVVKDAALATVLTNNTAISMGSGPVGANIAPTYTFTLTNSGTAPLTITSITSGSTVFALSPLTPVSPIAAGTSATFIVTAKPAVAGANPGVITIVSNDPTTPSFKLNVTATGTSGVLVVKDKTLATVVNDNVAISMGSSLITVAATPVYTFTLSNTGSGPLNVTSITSSSTVFAASAITPVSPIAAGGSATFTVTATPTLVGANTGFLTINTNDATTPAFKLNVSVTGTAPQLKVFDGATAVVHNSTTAINVGTATIGTPAPAYTTFSISNTGTGPLTLTSITGSTGFAVSAITPAVPATIAINGTATFTVIATPTLVGANAGTITVVTNDPTTPSFIIKVASTGTATTPKLTVLDGTTPLTTTTPAINIGTAAVGSPTALYTSFSIKNTGTAALTLTSITGSSPLLTISAITPAPGSIPVNGVVTFKVSGTPTVAGANPGTITIVTNDPTTPSFVINVVVTGTTVPTPAIKVLDGTTPITNNGTAVSVGAAFVGSPAPAYTTFSVTNVGTGPLSLTSIAGSAGFAVSAITPAAPSTIAVNGTTTFTVVGTPALVGSNAGTITVTTNDPTTPIFTIKVTVTGNPLVPTLKVFNGTTPVTSGNTPAINVGTAPIGVAATAFTTLSIQNTGNGALIFTSIAGSAGFAVVSTPGAPTSIAAGGTATITVTATPVSIGANPGTITITTNDPTTPSFVINVTATGVAASPIVEVYDNAMIAVPTNNTPAKSLGSVVAGSASAPYTFTVKNTGNVALTGLAVATTSPGFTVSAPSATTIAIGSSVTFTVTGTPATATTINGVINITSTNATAYVVNVSVTGTSAPTPTLQILDGTAIVVNNNSPAISVGSALINTAATAYTFTIKNNGTAPLTSIVVTGATGFTVTQPATTTIAAGASATFTVTGTPNSTTVPLTGAITIASNDAASPFKLNVTVTGTSTPTGVVSIPGVISGVTLVDLGSASQNSSTAPKTITIKNSGTAPLTIGTITSSNPAFTVTQVSPSTIAPGASGTFTITATPSTVGVTSGVITIPSNDPNSPFTINVKTTGTTIPTGAILQVLDNANGDVIVTSNSSPIFIGQNAINVAVAQYKFTLKNVGTTPITINSLPASSGFSSSAISPAGPIAPGASATIMVSGTPNSATAQRVGSITIMSNDGTGPFILNVSVRVGVPTAVSSALTANAIDMYPNPTNASSSLEFNGNFEDVNVVVYTVDGKTVITQNFASVVSSETTKINGVDELPAGIYLVEVTTTQGKLVKRLIKQ